jgi:hypothetical protein
MARTKKRRRKHRGTQGGSIDRRGRAGRPRSREEARARARSGMSKGDKAKRVDSPPTWSGAITRAAFGAGIFLLLLILIFKQSVAQSLGVTALIFLVYIPLGHSIDRFMYQRRLRAKQREYEKRKTQP